MVKETTSGMNEKDSYELEFAVDAKNELAALNVLAEVFGEQAKQEVTVSELAKRRGLFFVQHKFTSDELSDKNYKKALKREDLLIVSDEFSAKRAAELIHICIPVEVQLKKLLMYVWSGITSALDVTDKERTRLSICQKINDLTLGKLLNLLETDLATSRRKELMDNNGLALAQIIKESNTFDELKANLISYTTPMTVWDQVKTMLRQPVEHSEICNDLEILKAKRNKAAHPQVILNSDLVLAQKTADAVLEKINDVRNDYADKLNASIKSLLKAMGEALESSASAALVQATKDNFARNISQKFADAIRNASLSSSDGLKQLSQDIDWSDVSNKMGEHNPELKHILENMEQKGLETATKEMYDEIQEAKDEEKTDKN